MGIVVDTNIFIAAERGQFELARLHNLTRYEEAFLAAVTASELIADIHLAATDRERVHRSTFIERVLANIPVLDFDAHVVVATSFFYIRIQNWQLPCHSSARSSRFTSPSFLLCWKTSEFNDDTRV